MSKFSDDVKLLADLQSYIEEEKRSADPPAYLKDVAGAISPLVKAMVPAASKRAKAHVEVLTRARDRLAELMDEAKE